MSPEKMGDISEFYKGVMTVFQLNWSGNQTDELFNSYFRSYRQSY